MTQKTLSQARSKGGGRRPGRGRWAKDPSPFARRGFRHWPRTMQVLSVVSALVVVGALSTGAYYLTAGSNPCAAGLTMSGSDCVGVTDGSPQPFIPEIGPIERLIAKENSHVVSDGEPYVSIALLTPMNPSANISAARIQQQLEGAYTEQYWANERDHLTPQIRLLLANEGSQEQGWQPVVDKLVGMQKSPDNLIAVIGMGISVPNTVLSAQALSKAHIPMIGSIDTSDGLDSNGPSAAQVAAGSADSTGPIAGLTRVAPDNSQEVAALTAYFNQNHLDTKTAVMISNSDPSDMYTASLATDFQKQFGFPTINILPFNGDAGATNNADGFGQIADAVCTAGKQLLVAYAGRDDQLPTLIQQFQGDFECKGQHITLVTGSDAAELPLADTSDTATTEDVSITVLYAGLTDPGSVTEAFSNAIEAAGLSDNPDRNQPWLIMSYDATAVPARILKDLKDPGSIPQAADLESSIHDYNFNYKVSGFVGATGAFGIGNLDGDEQGQVVPIVNVSNGAANTVSLWSQ